MIVTPIRNVLLFRSKLGFVAKCVPFVKIRQWTIKQLYKTLDLDLIFVFIDVFDKYALDMLRAF